MTGPFNRIIEAVAAIATKLGATVTNTGNRLADNLEGIAEVAGGGGGGGGLAVETVYVDEAAYVKGFKTATDAEDIFDAYRAGGSVVAHIPGCEEWSVKECWISLTGYQPDEEYDRIVFNGGSTDMTGWMTSPYVRDDGKLFIPIYID